MNQAPVPDSTRSVIVGDAELYHRFQARVLEGPDAGLLQSCETPELTIGTADANTLVLHDPAVSRHHCAISATPLGFLIKDLGSKNGSFLAGYRVEAAFLKDGATLRLGNSVLRFEILAERVSEPLSREGEFGRLLAQSTAMRKMFAAMPKVAQSDLTVLLEGETGTGKGLLAEAIHKASARKDAPFIVVDCSAMPAGLIEAELFGYLKGAFTGAVAARPGAFEAANGGTVFLDEIGELPLEMQPKLLRALEERTVKRIGATTPLQLDVRLIAATNRDLRREVNRGTFRSDLFYRLCAIPLRIPPLRERPEDIPLLVAHFYRQVAPIPGNAPSAEFMKAMSAHDWPGNVRELRSAVERAALMEDPDVWRSFAEPAQLDEAPRSSFAPDEGALPFRAAKERAVAAWEHAYLERLVTANNGNLSAAARQARMDRNHLRELLVRHKLHMKDRSED
jgi:two-component system response regulator GlrR